MARSSTDPRDYIGVVFERNELRREARLPLLDMEAETARLRQLDLNAAYANFFAHLMVPHNVKWDRPQPPGRSRWVGWDRNVVPRRG